jgi:site-specific DNA-methyltransferase (adenine-specific)
VKKSSTKPAAKRKTAKDVRESGRGYQASAGAKEAPYFDRDNITIFNADVLTTSVVANDSVDLIVTSPPYNVDIAYNSHHDKLDYNDYLEFTQKWIAKCFKLAKPEGRFCLNIPLDKNKDGQQSVCADITTIAKSVGWKYHSTIIWNEQNISRRTAWGSWLSASAPFVIAPVEVIVVLYKESWKKTSGSGVSDTTRDEFMAWTNGVWTFGGESKKRIGHPAPYPVELPRRCIKLFSFVGDTVLDPFLGSGTTLIAAFQTKRRGIGLEIDRAYCKLAVERLVRDAQINQLQLAEVTHSAA